MNYLAMSFTRLNIYHINIKVFGRLVKWIARASLALLFCPFAHATFTSQASGYVNDLDPGQDVQSTGCSFLTSMNAGQSCTFSANHKYDSSGGGTINSGSSAASVDAKGIHIYTQDLLSLYGDFMPGYKLELSSGAYASYTDAIRVTTSVATGYILLTLHTEGSLYNGTSFQSNLYVNQAGCVIRSAGVCSIRALVDFGQPIVIGADASGTAIVNVGGQDGECCVYGSASESTVDFSNTAFLSDLSFTYLNDVKLDATYVTDSGFLYAESVPEPSVTALMSSALILIFLVRRSDKKRKKQ